MVGTERLGCDYHYGCQRWLIGSLGSYEKERYKGGLERQARAGQAREGQGTQITKNH